MMAAIFEHVNVTVSDPEATAALYERLFGWGLRWQGGSIHNGHSVHVGTQDQYVALYRAPGAQAARRDSYHDCGGLNHIAVVVDDLDATEARVVAEGYEAHSHQDYAPGRRFYFNDADGIEYEVVSYR
jgi:predicted enzyme related to lactoylglutathione lyase